MPNYEIVTMKNKVTVKCANQKMEQDLVITYKDALSSERSLKKLLDTTQSSYGLFRGVEINVNELIEYDDTENVTNMGSMFAEYKGTEVPLLNTSKVQDMSQMFYNAKNIISIPQYETSNVTKLSYTFYGCHSLKEIPQLNTSNVTNMQEMCYNCKSLTSIPELDTSNVTNMHNIYYGAWNLTFLPQINTDKLTDIGYAFYDCHKLEKIDITSLDNITSSFNGNGICNSCYSLKKFIIRTMTKVPIIGSETFGKAYHILGTVDATYNPEGLKDGYIYVPDNMVDSLKSATNWSTYATQIKPLSELVED